MAVEKKVTTKPAEKAIEAAVKTNAPKTDEKKTAKAVIKDAVKDVAPTATKDVAKAAAPAETKKAEAPAVPAPVKAVDKPAAKKTVAKKLEVKKPVKKAELKSALHVQFAGKSYSQEDLVKMAKDVWKYDLKQKAGDLVSMDLYVKPEENTVYYVMNDEFTGSFYI